MIRPELTSRPGSCLSDAAPRHQTKDDVNFRDLLIRRPSLLAAHHVSELNTALGHKGNSTKHSNGIEIPLFTMANGYSIFVGLVVIAAMCVAAWFFAPKGENQVYVPPYESPLR